MVGVPHDIKGVGIYAFVTARDGVEYTEQLKKEICATVRKVLRATFAGGGGVVIWDAANGSPCDLQFGFLSQPLTTVRVLHSTSTSGLAYFRDGQ